MHCRIYILWQESQESWTCVAFCIVSGWTRTHFHQSMHTHKNKHNCGKSQTFIIIIYWLHFGIAELQQQKAEERKIKNCRRFRSSVSLYTFVPGRPIHNTLVTLQSWCMYHFGNVIIVDKCLFLVLVQRTKLSVFV